MTEVSSEVTQTDRDAAASAFPAVCEDMREAIRFGMHDESEPVQAFARHRDAEARRCAEIMQRITQANALPGDVGTVAEIKAHVDRYTVHDDERRIYSTAQIETAIRLALINRSACPGDVGPLRELVHESLFHLRLDDAAKAYHDKALAALSDTPPTKREVKSTLEQTVKDLLKHRIGDLPNLGYIKDTDTTRDIIARLVKLVQ